MVIPASSTEYIHVPVTSVTGGDFTGSPPRIAVLPVTNRGNPAPDDWHQAEWVTTAAGTEARILIGPNGGALALQPGDHRVWITFDPPGGEDITRMSGYLSVT